MKAKRAIPEGMVDAAGLADALGVSKGTVYGWVKEKLIPEHRVSPRKVFFSVEEVQRERANWKGQHKAEPVAQDQPERMPAAPIRVHGLPPGACVLDPSGATVARAGAPAGLVDWLLKEAALCRQAAVKNPPIAMRMTTIELHLLRRAVELMPQYG